MYDFFSDSEYKNWRIFEKIDSEENSKSFLIDPKKDFQLSKELKSLYVALTRTIDKLWIFDHDTHSIEYFLEYLLRRGVIIPKMGMGELAENNFHAAASSSDWAKKGDLFFEKAMYKEALTCYRWAGDNIQAALCEAFLLNERAEDLLANKKPKEAKHSFNEAGQLFVVANRAKEAAIMFTKAENWKEATESLIDEPEPELFLKCCNKSMLSQLLVSWSLKNPTVPQDLLPLLSLTVRKLALAAYVNDRTEEFVQTGLLISSNGQKDAFFRRWGFGEKLAQHWLERCEDSLAATTYAKDAIWFKAAKSERCPDAAKSLLLRELYCDIYVRMPLTHSHDDLKEIFGDVISRPPFSEKESSINYYLKSKVAIHPLRLRVINQLLFEKQGCDPSSQIATNIADHRRWVGFIKPLLLETAYVLLELCNTRRNLNPVLLLELFGIDLDDEYAQVRPDILKTIGIPVSHFDSNMLVDRGVLSRRLTLLARGTLSGPFVKCFNDAIEIFETTLTICQEKRISCSDAKCANLHGLANVVSKRTVYKIAYLIDIYELFKMIQERVPGLSTINLTEKIESALIRASYWLYDPVYLTHSINMPGSRDFFFDYFCAKPLNRACEMNISRMFMKLFMMEKVVDISPGLLKTEHDLFQNLNAALYCEIDKSAPAMTSKCVSGSQILKSIGYMIRAAKACADRLGLQGDKTKPKLENKRLLDTLGCFLDIIDLMIPRILICTSILEFMLIPARHASIFLFKRTEALLDDVANSERKFGSHLLTHVYSILIATLSDTLDLVRWEQVSPEELAEWFHNVVRCINNLLIISLNQQEFIIRTLHVFFSKFANTHIGESPEFRKRYGFLLPYRAISTNNQVGKNLNDILSNVYSFLLKMGEGPIVLHWCPPDRLPKYVQKRVPLPPTILMGKNSAGRFVLNFELIREMIKDPLNTKLFR